ncbi:MAG: chitinase, partial [Patescibacteria group bacterium]
MKQVSKEKAVIPNGPTRRLSPWRVLLAILVVGGLAYCTTLGVDRWKESESVTVYKPWFAAYVDVTSTPVYPFEQLGSTEASDAILSFIVASSPDSCTPTWGTYYTMDEAATGLDLDRRIARLQQQGGRIAVSFGGALNSELAVSCKDQEALFHAYKSVIERYNIDTIDLDLENQSLKDSESAKRRAIVIAKLQEEYRKNGKSLAVWLTLPVAPQGLTPEGTGMVAEMLSAKVDIAGVNLMTMDYGDSRADDQTMLSASQQALNETHRQLGILYKQAGINLNSVSLWRKIGATPMIGQNDIVDEVFTLEDAKGFNTFSRNQGVGRMSMWSANRDTPCGENYVDVKIVSDSCSGTKEKKFSFSEALRNGFDGDLTQSAKILTTEDPESNVYAVDDPEKSPYQIWQETGAYPKGVKVVWHGNVYEAKWWTKNDLPDNPVLQSWETPWQLVGPVLLGEKPIEQATLPEDTYPEWSGEVSYEGGDRVLFEGVPFQAKWWNEG